MGQHKSALSEIIAPGVRIGMGVRMGRRSERTRRETTFNLQSPNQNMKINEV